MFLRLLGCALFAAVAGCGGNLDQGSKLADVVEMRELLSCRAMWMCKGDVRPRGFITNRGRFLTGQSDACIADLDEQLKGLGQCPEGEMLDRDSIELMESTVEVSLLPLASDNGKRLNNLLNHLYTIIDDGCDGSECTDRAWPEMIKGYKALPKWQEYLSEKDLVLSKPILNNVIKLAARMCSTNHTGAKGWLDEIWKHTFIAGQALVSLQRASFYSPVQCPRILGKRPKSKRRP